ncbi:unnamed protein product [Blepharisma stoltei]|uniref:Uncharacterized protein n=1 Tax=Blepharisma stoltei TaxID=1481888 RepID=A0AAU9IR28_9CILI|nr:unnamed protein product [Blepharisma stoltei]
METILLVFWILINCLLAYRELRVIKECPFFMLNDHISILETGSFQPWLSSNATSISKLFSDSEFIYNLIAPHLRDEEKCALQDQEKLQIMFPSAIWLPEKEKFLTIVRLRINQRISVLYASFYDSDWNEVNTEEMIGVTLVPGILIIEIPESEIWNSGPEDPRIFKAGNEIYVAYNMLDIDRKRKMWLYKFSNGFSYPLSMKIHKVLKFYNEKNWTPFIIDNEHLYFIYNYKNFQVIDCTDLTQPCTEISGKYFRFPGGLRGGSPYTQFRSTNYYISFAYTHIEYSKSSHHCSIYRPALTISKVSKNPLKFDLVYTSEPLDFKGKLFIEPITRIKSFEDINLCGDGRIMMALSISRWNYNKDIVDITFSLNDTISVAAEVSGLTKLVDEIIWWYEYKRLPKDNKCAERLAYIHFGIPNPERDGDKVEYVDSYFIVDWE